MLRYCLGKMDKLYISGFACVKDNELTTHASKLNYEGLEFAELMKKLYHHNNQDYPKFYKMDNLSKLSFITAETLLKKKGFQGKYKEERVGIVLTNHSSSIDSDQRHVESFSDKNNYFPSPSVFVYTLPNIAIGEICIRNSIKGENALFIAEREEQSFAVDYIISLLLEDRIDCCIGGWIEYSKAGYEAFLYLVEKEAFVEEKEVVCGFTERELKNILR